MMHQFLSAKLERTREQAKKVSPLSVLREIEANSTEEEKKRAAEIKAKLHTFIKNKDLEGAIKYLNQMRKNEYNNSGR